MRVLQATAMVALVALRRASAFLRPAARGPARSAAPLVRPGAALVARRAASDGVGVDAPKLVVDPETGEEMSKNALKKLQKKRAQAARKAAKAADRAAAAPAAAAAAAAAAAEAPSRVAAEPVAFGAAPAAYDFGDYAPCVSAARGGGAPTPVAAVAAGERAWVRARVAAVRSTGRGVFFVLRDGAATLQACYFGDKAARKWLEALPVETVVDARGAAAAADVAACTRGDVELQIESLFVVARAPAILPFLVEDAGRSDAAIEASLATERPFAAVSQDARLDSRWLDLRTPAQNAIMRLQAAVCRLFREALDARGFVEIHSPKLVAGESESGAGVFTTDYFGQTACLAQSPQLYKQLAVCGDLGGVYEVGPVFRAENSNTRRHLCEFTGLDFELPIAGHYDEAIAVGHGVFRALFEGLERDHADLLAAVRDQYPSAPAVVSPDPVVLSFDDAVAKLAAAGRAVDGDDFSGADEIALGNIVKEERGVDFFVVDRYPAAIRPFYTMPAPDDPARSNSYDFFLRGQEICSGAQRVHDPAILRANLRAKGLDPDNADGTLAAYMTAFDHGAPPHAGCGFGLERVLFLYLGLDNIRQASLFPRDPKRCSP